MLAVFREEEEGKDGLKKSVERSRARFPLLLDTPVSVTQPYSVKGFHTYIVDPAGVVQADLSGTKMQRPTAQKILAALAEAQQAGGSE